LLLLVAAVAFEARRDPLGRVGRACREAGQSALEAGRGLLGWLRERRARVLKTLAAGNSGGGRGSPEGKGSAGAGGSSAGAPPPSHGAPWLPEDFVGEDLVSTHMALVDYSSDGTAGTSGSSGASSPNASPAGTPVRAGSVEDVAFAAALAGEARERCIPAPSCSSTPEGGSSEGGSADEGAGGSPDAVASHRLADLSTRGGKKGDPRRERYSGGGHSKRQPLQPWSLENAMAAEVVPPSFCCPITHERMNDPVIAADGHTYERVAIARWLRHHATSPSTNLPLKHRGVIPNHSLRSAILDFGQQRTDAFVNV
jgi:hypothetical protein